jgi:uroporphyrinogen-III synthase
VSRQAVACYARRVSTLVGKRVLVTRASHQAGDLRRALEAEGAIVLELPLIEIVPVSGAEAEALAAAIARLRAGHYDAVLFGSANAARLVVEAGAEVPARTRIFTIGEATRRALGALGEGAAVAEVAVSEGLLESVQREFGKALRGHRFFYPRAREGRDVAIDALRAAGTDVDLVVAYETQSAAELPDLPRALDWITLASPSAVRAFVERFGSAATARVACIGPVTEAAARELGLRVDLVARDHSAAGLVRALLTT